MHTKAYKELNESKRKRKSYTEVAKTQKIARMQQTQTKHYVQKRTMKYIFL